MKENRREVKVVYSKLSEMKLTITTRKDGSFVRKM